MAFQAYQYFSFGRRRWADLARINIAWRKSNVYKASNIASVISIFAYATTKTFFHSDILSGFAALLFVVSLLFNLVWEPIIFRKISQNEVDEELKMMREKNQERLERFDRKYDAKITAFGKVMKWLFVLMLICGAAIVLLALYRAHLL